ncbi:DUF4179 domain-containing protein [Paraclostridium sordellii]|uniref:DUF4179 domain-containing protein n=1 Tax=Paraclostridium sordellii TaxID=1505 RepID=UPI0005E46831|nr:DUF4179 domain-containing protein [Paeniclostridium sordellii]CEN21128.1 hypothetical protein DUF4179 [[Clostridium] sordellii] [Paeniclostridium sordellii]CEP40411.1 hypothetical protein DUF4179 [[Clostridium] sordellii] [Paeniclostridium sordellii]CEP43675.1 hypothetical protein DUF4179 [[Clostridium] sordellii] [Paeniclostridium sordellii]CEP98553.1 hypothetical protein DUF4179 [[Clostridium] sordellii] [Paeniclostridium sordellii]
MSKYDEIKMPDNIDAITKNAISKGRKQKNIRKYKNVMVASIATLVVVGGVMGVINPSLADSIPIVRNIVKYFDNNKDSRFKGDKRELEKTSNSLNLSVKDKGIEFKVNSISYDESCMTVFYTIKTDKNIKENYKVNENPLFDHPSIDLYINGKRVNSYSNPESESKYIGSNKLEGIYRFDMSGINIKANDKVELKIDNIFDTDGTWNIATNLDKSKTNVDSHIYKVNKKFTIGKTNYDIKEVIISPLGNKMLLQTSELNDSNEGSKLLAGFALMDDKGKILNIIDNGSYGPDEKTGIATNSFEFIGADSSTKYLQAIPRKYIRFADDKMSEPQSINSLPLTFKTSEVGKIKIDSFKVTGDKIEFTYYKEGLVDHEIYLEYFDKDGNEVDFGGLQDTYVDRKTGKYTQTINLNGYKHNEEKIKSISKISVSYLNDEKLLKDKAIKIELNK